MTPLLAELTASQQRAHRLTEAVGFLFADSGFDFSSLMYALVGASCFPN
jgi:hypothetical protein